MISWIQRTFQRHFGIIFSILLTVIIISFIFTIGSTPGLGRAGPKILHREFFGLDLSKVETTQRLREDARLSVTLRGIDFLFQDSAQLETYGLQRTAALALADQLKIPVPTREELAAKIQTFSIFHGADGKFDALQYARFRDNLKSNSRVSEGDFARVLRGDIRIEQLLGLLSGPGYVLPSEIRDHLLRAESAWTIAIGTIDYADFKPDIPVADDALARFFEEHAASYEMTARTGVDYIEFRADDYLGAVEVADDEVRAFYDANPARFPKPEEKKVEGEDPALPQVTAKNDDPGAVFALVRPQVEQALRIERAKIFAARAAADLTVALFEQKVKPQTPPFEAMLAAEKLTLKHAPPLNKESVPPELGWTPEIAREAVRLTEERPVSDVLPSGAGSLVLFWRETQPAYRPQLVQVRERVLADYRENKRRKKFSELGKALHSQIEARLKAGEKFKQAAAAVEPKLAVKTYINFTLSQLPEEIDHSVPSVLERLEQGQVSEMVVSQQGKGVFVYAEEKKAPDLAETSQRYTAARQQLAQASSGISEQLYLDEMVERELKKSEPAAAR